MGHILAFTPREAARKPADAGLATPAIIIMFTGVRYERHQPAEQPLKWTAGGGMPSFQPTILPQV